MRKLLHRIQPLLAVVAAGFIALMLYRQAPALRAVEWRLNPVWLGLSALFMLAAWAVEIRVWTGLVALLGAHLRLLPAARIWFLTAVVRYIPGNIWQPLSMTLYAQQEGVRTEIAVTSIVMYQLVTVVSVGPLAALYFAATGNWGMLLAGGPGAATWPLLLMFVAPVVGLVLLPGVALRFLNWMLERARRPRIELVFRRRKLALLVLLALLSWLLWGTTFAALVFGLTPNSAAEMERLFLHLVPAYAIAYTIGFLSFLLPSGLGVREGALYVLLAPIMGAPLVTVAALAFRVWNILGEVVMATMAAFVGRRRVTQTATASPSPVAVDKEPAA